MADLRKKLTEICPSDSLPPNMWRFFSYSAIIVCSTRMPHYTESFSTRSGGSPPGGRPAAAWRGPPDAVRLRRQNARPPHRGAGVPHRPEGAHEVAVVPDPHPPPPPAPGSCQAGTGGGGCGWAGSLVHGLARCSKGPCTGLLMYYGLLMLLIYDWLAQQTKDSDLGMPWKPPSQSKMQCAEPWEKGQIVSIPPFPSRSSSRHMTGSTSRSADRGGRTPWTSWISTSAPASAPPLCPAT